MDQEKMLIELVERVAKLDADLENHISEDSEMHVLVRDVILHPEHGIQKRLEVLDAKLSKQVTFVGGIVFAITSLWAIIGTFKDHIGMLFK